MKKYIAIGIIVTMIILSFTSPHLMLNSGELSEGHQDIENDCFKCHTAFQETPNSKCIACHAIDKIGLDTVSNNTNNILFHKALGNQKCISCHTDHIGLRPDHAIKSFNHKLLSTTSLNNCNSCHTAPGDKLHQNVSINCSSCHNTNAWESVGAFNHENLSAAIKSNCVSCHQQPNDNFHTVNTTACESCHSTQQWTPSTFNHSDYFELDKHHNVSCGTCHTGNNYKNYTCYGCHEHTENNIRNEHIEEGIYNYTKCADCHKNANEDDIRIPNQYKTQQQIDKPKGKKSKAKDDHGEEEGD
jgi:nitrate/TMAO reductase-like tetraheme cytochrome c subunit